MDRITVKNILISEYEKPFASTECLIDSFQEIGDGIFLQRKSIVNGSRLFPQIINEKERSSYTLTKRKAVREVKW